MEFEEKYNQALDFIYSFINHSMTRQKLFHSEEYNLSRMKKMMEYIGNPEKKYPTIHIAGTKGKGSIAAFICSALKEQGYKTGLYTSPHLIEFEERIQINFEPISKKELVEIVEEIKPIILKFENVTTFEIITMIGFVAFAKNNVDIAVIEVGLGGRLDATNIITPILSIISPLAIDHTNFLGNTIESIAFEKSGIIKKNVPVVFAKQEYQETLPVIYAIAKEKNSDIIDLNNFYTIENIKRSLNTQSFIIKYKNIKKEFKIKMLGDFQIENCVTAYFSLLKISEKIVLSNKAIEKGISEAFWNGRFEILSEKPLIIIDSAHNPYSIEKLLISLRSYFPNKKIILIFGVSIDKNVNKMIEILRPEISLLIASNSNHPKAMEQKQIQHIAEKYDINSEFSKDASDALKIANKKIKSNEIIVCTGSIFMAASLKAAYEEKN